MKLMTNFTLPIRKLLLTVFLLSITTSISFLMVAYHMGRDRGSLLNENKKLNEVLAVLSDKANTNRSDGQLKTASERTSIRARIEQLNSHTPVKGVSVNHLLNAIEETIPEGVRVNRLGYSAIDGQLNLVAESDDPDRIYLFMKRLEQNSLFDSPLLQQQPGIGSGSRSVTQYEIHVAARKI